jgi:hypothetical protein
MLGTHPPSENGCDNEQDGILESCYHVNLFGERIVDKNCEIFPGSVKKINNAPDFLHYDDETVNP